MKNLFDPVLVEETRRRIAELATGGERQWGTMTLVQALAHCTSGLDMAMGTVRTKRAPFPATLLAVLIKPLVFRDDKPMRRNSPLSPELFMADPASNDLEREQARLLAAIDNFASNGAARCSTSLHPFFGKLTPEQWAILMYKHVDHHLRQFGG
jgi:hypothetical protein